MFHIRLDDNRTHRTDRTNRFASATSDTKIRIDLRNRQRPFVGNHMHSLSRTVFRTGATVFFFRIHDATAFEEGGNADLSRDFLFNGQRFDRTCRAYIGTYRTFVVAITADVGEAWFQHIIQTIFQSCRTEHLAWTADYTYLASRTFVFETFQADRTRRGEGRPFLSAFSVLFTFSRFFGNSRYDRQGSGYCRTCRQECTAAVGCRRLFDR